MNFPKKEKYHIEIKGDNSSRFLGDYLNQLALLSSMASVCGLESLAMEMDARVPVETSTMWQVL